MPTFTGRHSDTVLVSAPPARAAAAFADLDRQARCHPELAGAERLDATSIRMRMKEMNHGPVAFAGRYTLVFSTSGNTVRWHTGPDSNVDVRGEAVFLPAAGGSRMEYAESVTLNMDVNAILARVLRPLVETMMGRGMRSFLERMTAELNAVR